jgi:hypothetical protein
MRNAEADAVERIADAVRRHLEANPGATESATGIIRWWLGQVPETAGSLADVERALERLEASGAVERAAGRNGRVAYRARAARADGRATTAPAAGAGTG